MFTVTYQLAGTEREARKAAELICIDQTVEAPDAILPPDVRERIVGRIERFERAGEHRFEAEIGYPTSLLDDSIAQLLAVMYGISSLRQGIRIVGLDLPDEALQRFPGPRFGISRLRELTGVRDRPLVCTVLKPVGLSAEALAGLAAEFVRGGVDLIKDDQGLVDQPFCRFEERVRRCAETVADAARKRGRPCLYLPHVTGRPDVMIQRAAAARSAGAGGLLVCPGLTGFDALARMAADATIDLPILSHPALLGSFTTNESSGLAPWIIYGHLPRLAGADASLYPSFGRSFAITADDCRRTAAAARSTWGALRPMFPTAAGRIGIEESVEMQEFYGGDVVFIVGSRVQQDPSGIAAGCAKLMRTLR